MSSIDDKHKHRYARTVDGKWVNTSEGERKVEYFCGCPDKHKMTFVQWYERPNTRPFKPYFRHLPEQTTGLIPLCRGGGESQEHKEAKHILRERIGQYYFKISECKECGTCEEWRPPPNARVEMEMRSDKYVYDCMVMDGETKVMALEIFHTHKTGVEKVENTMETIGQIAEFTSEDVLNMKPDQCLNNLLCRRYTCESCIVKAENEKKAFQEACRIAAIKKAETDRVAAAAREERDRAAAAEKLAKRREIEAANAESTRLRLLQSAARDKALQRESDKNSCFDAWKNEHSKMGQVELQRYYYYHAMPIPVPSEAIDHTPRELWAVIWEEHPLGVEMPASVPKKLWDAQWKRRNPELSLKQSPPLPPPLLRSYWGRLRGNALVDRKRKRDSDDSSIPPVFGPPLSRSVWQRYFELFPDGHPAPPQEPYRPAAYGEQAPPKYSLIKGSLHVNVSSNPACPIWRPSTGVDAWDKHGAWLGPG